MSRNVADLRFSISDHALGHSSVWRFWVSRHGDIYMATRDMAGIIKLSFHRSGICRYAFTTEHGVSTGLNDRLLERWHRAPIPHRESENFARLAWIAFPTDYLSNSRPTETQRVTHIPPAASGMATFVEIGLCRRAKDELHESTNGDIQADIASYSPIFDDVAVFMRWYHGTWENRDVRIPASHGKPAYRFLASEAPETARPIRLTMQSRPKDGDAMLITELGGCLDVR
jgi:hypothetical protein